MAYVDGFVLPVPKKNLAAYKRMARKFGTVIKELGATEYHETVSDDVKPGKLTSFPRALKLKKNEVVMFSWVVYPSKAVRMSVNTGFNPMRAESDARGAAWLTDWLDALANLDGKALTPIQLQALSDAVQANMNADTRLQNFEQFRSQLRATDDDGDLYNRFGRWDEAGQFGWLFGGKGLDALSFDARISAFDVTEIFDNNIIRTAWLSYVFRRIERLVEDEYPTLLVLDEAWRLLDDPYFQLRLKDWMLTMRKKNVAVLLLTQRVSHITNCAAGDAILESAVTRLIYPSAYNTEAELAPLNLTPTESAFLQMSNVDNPLVLFKSGQNSVVLDFALRTLGKGLEILGGGRGEKAPQGWRDDPRFPMEHLK